MFVRKPSYRAIWIAVFAGMATLALAWIAWADSAINFLPRDGRAEWIIFPTAVDAHAHSFASLDATFGREFILGDQPATAHLSVRAMRRAEVKINGVLVRFRPSGNWKEVTSTNVAGQLRAGTNTLEARVSNYNGPPALWLTLVTHQLSLRSDESWEASFAGSSWRHATLAEAVKIPGSGNSIAGRASTFDAVKQNWLFCLVLIAIASAVILLCKLCFKQSTVRLQARTLLLVLASLWLLLFWNNARLLPFHRGFDWKDHLEYVTYIQQHWSLPSPTEGWEMYQPPLYYLIAAASLSACKLSVEDPTSIYLLRCLGAFFGIANFVLVFLTLRLLLPLRAALIGLLLAAFLPMHLYIAHYVTNELLSAALTTAALYLSVRLLKSEMLHTSQFVWVGLALGGAMLAKTTASLLLPIMIVAIAGKLLARREPIATSLQNVTVLLTVCFVISGWHYARIWLRFGTPLLGNWDVVSGFTWWQDPGFYTAAHYLRFGRSLIYPLFSGFVGFADGIYSTLWGDGLCGGISSASIAWNQRPMLVGYLWGTIPAVMIFAGAAVALIRFIRNPSSELFLLIGFSAVIGLGLAFMTLKVPSYAQAKAFYGLSALTPLCFFGALGWEMLTSRRTRSQFILSALTLVWAINSFATHWIVRSASQHLYAVKALGIQGKIDPANAEAAKAVEADPSNAAAREFHALSLNELGRDEEAIKEAEHATELDPTGSDAHLDLAISVRRSDHERAIAEARRAIELGPENFSAYQFLMNCLFESHCYNEAVDLGREWLTVTPYDAAAHSELGSALAENGDFVSAAQQLGYLIMLRPDLEEAHAKLRQMLLLLAREPDGLQRLREIAGNAPDSPRMLDELAWLLATYPDSKSRDGAEAVRLAERACDLTKRRIPVILDTLGAAYAEAGDFPRAISAIKEALKLSRSSGDSDAVKLSENILASVHENLPYRQQPE